MWRFAAARVPGTSHVSGGLPCQDDFTSTTDGDLFVAAIADGAGSVPMAERGASTVVRSVAASVEAALQLDQADPVTILKEAALAARRELAAIADQEGLPVRDFASTLLAVVAGPKGGAALQIGDGIIVVGDDGSHWSWVFWPQHGEYANTTHFLTDEDAPELLQIQPLPPHVSDIALMSDGLERLTLHHGSRSIHRPFFAGIFEPLLAAKGKGEITNLSAALEEFLRSESVAARTDDDLSLVIATRRHPQPPPEWT
jgi:hypothetical protein